MPNVKAGNTYHRPTFSLHTKRLSQRIFIYKVCMWGCFLAVIKIYGIYILYDSLHSLTTIILMLTDIPSKRVIC